jgi:hypothetical protein
MLFNVAMMLFGYLFLFVLKNSGLKVSITQAHCWYRECELPLRISMEGAASMVE